MKSHILHQLHTCMSSNVSHFNSLIVSVVATKGEKGDTGAAGLPGIPGIIHFRIKYTHTTITLTFSTIMILQLLGGLTLIHIFDELLAGSSFDVYKFKVRMIVC